MVITFSNMRGSAGGGGASCGSISGITLWSDETTKAYIDNALSGVTDVLSAYTPTSGFSTINGNVITDGGNIEIQGGNTYTAGANIDISTDNVISVTGITLPTKVSELVNDSGYITTADTQNFITSGDAQTQINDSISGKADLSAVTAQISDVKQEIEAKIPSKVSDLQNDLNFASTGDVETQITNKDYPTKNWVQDQVSGKLDTSDFITYTANTQTELNNKQDASAMTAYYTSAQTDTAIQNATNGLASEEWVESQGYLTGYTETDPVFQASAASGITSQDITNWNGKQPSGDYALRSELPTVPTSNTAFTNDAGFITDAALSGYATEQYVDNSVSGKVDSSRVDEIEEVTASALVELNSTKQDILVSGTNIKTINNESILGSGNIVIQGGSGSDYSAGANIDISTDNVISVTGITIPSKLSELTNDEGFVDSGEVNTQIESKGYITGFTESDPVFQASAASGITEQNITNWNNKLDSSDLEPYYTSAQTDTVIDNATSGKQDTLVSGTNIKTINNQSILGSGNIQIQGGSGGGSNIIELTQAEYDALTAYTEDAMYVITDAQDINIDNYEMISNKVNSISAESTDEEYPSAKCVYDMIGNIETLLATI